MAARGNVLLALGLVGVLLGTGGCVADEPEPARSLPHPGVPTTSPTPNPAQEEFLQALRRTNGAPYRYAVRGDLPDGASVQATGAFDPVARLFESTTKSNDGKKTETDQRIVVGANSYARALADKTWVHLDLSRVKPDSLVWFDMADPTGLVKFTSMIGTVQQSGPNAYKGTFSPATSGLKPFIPLGAPSIVSLGVYSADFTATTNAQGWVTSITIEVQAAKGPALTMTTDLSGHGTKLGIKAPPKSKVDEAADIYYEK
ncbi:hypothetical protein F4553_000364 [Allocatelliglobosispora scoriae]|uniref:Lipoprotein n=1 Tax=Allocatelliglobosispora scoriae TaxID=643052 RepID=A0A841BH75_9ACTN|nr:hypothetical protein [Allocatelliglobosispora scoriae]MBB5866985.1 hypothetical protein [Allocatelliglobosispora scoriae]